MNPFEDCEVGSPVYALLAKPELYLHLSDDDEEPATDSSAFVLQAKHATQPPLPSESSIVSFPCLTAAHSIASEKSFVDVHSQSLMGGSSAGPSLSQEGTFLINIVSPSMCNTSGSAHCSEVTASSQQQTSQTSVPASNSRSISMNVYSRIANSPYNAKPIYFRNFLTDEPPPLAVEQEESSGIFVGQLPSSYMERDIIALLKAIGHECGRYVQVRDIKCHNRDRTCAFIMINSKALPFLLSFSKRVLCDLNCLWVVDASQAPLIPQFIQQMPRVQLRGVPKVPLVLEKLTPQKPRGGEEAVVQAPCTHGRQPAMRFPPFNQSPNLCPSTGMPYCPTSGLLDNSLPSMFSMGSMMSFASFPSTRLPPSTVPFNHSPAHGFTGDGMRQWMPHEASIVGVNNMGVSNQSIHAGPRSRQNSTSSPTSLLNTPTLRDHAHRATPTTIFLAPVLHGANCSCGRSLHLSQSHNSGNCIKCRGIVKANTVAYWCTAGHVALCSMCAVELSNASSAPHNTQNVGGGSQPLRGKQGTPEPGNIFFPLETFGANA